MSSTNKTTNYELSQFVGSDKPAWLGDYNADMSKIDAQMKLNSDASAAAAGTASTASTNIGTLSNLTTTDKTSLVAAVNEVKTAADTAQGTANSASNTAQANTTSINNLNDYLNLNNFTTPTINYTNATTIGTSTRIECASNNTGSLGKIYGQIRVKSTGTTFRITFPTPLRPSETITINGLVTHFYNDVDAGGGDNWTPVPKSITIGTDGTATFVEDQSVANRQNRIFFNASVIFAKAFGDTYTPSD